ncbi:hypothetical protein QYF36_027078 [Acer negundo]|nr:hypothetical protein QYF36_027078 [Acer negundo]
MYKSSNSWSGKSNVATSDNSGMSGNKSDNGPMSDKNKGSVTRGTGMGKFGQHRVTSRAKGDVDVIMAEDCAQTVMNSVVGNKDKGKVVLTEKTPEKSSMVTSIIGLPGQSCRGVPVAKKPNDVVGSVHSSDAEPPDSGLKEFDNASVLRQLHVDVMNFEGQPPELNGDSNVNEMIPIETVPVMDSFKKVASDLVEVMVVISE